ncbi:hypothetical protein FGM00_11240 [Aggregatimonas sangjinii]|uniref:Uncharacterized protein n=1 Tax=Aggregatimonas sangjinii TaxID=2583587 RepID=A0A5B7SUS2_9FLAO|nr:hypothetical protein [Aggregatimonas sangjinii]QCX00651.1 hypothetical protein FGM00_11240 [Aggregatimonas sangjinii]
MSKIKNKSKGNQPEKGTSKQTSPVTNSQINSEVKDLKRMRKKLKKYKNTEGKEKAAPQKEKKTSFWDSLKKKGTQIQVVLLASILAGPAII